MLFFAALRGFGFGFRSISACSSSAFEYLNFRKVPNLVISELSRESAVVRDHLNGNFDGIHISSRVGATMAIDIVQGAHSVIESGDEIIYVPDPKFHDELENPLAVLKTGGADCEDMAVLLVAMQKAIGNEVRLVFVPGHAYAQVKIPKYKNRWLNMEATCKTCSFNEVPTDTLIQKKQFVFAVLYRLHNHC